MDRKDIEKLKSCAHCKALNGNPMLIEQGHTWNGLRRTKYRVQCLDCGIMTLDYHTKEQAIAVWNTRHEPEPRVLTIEELQKKALFDWVWIEALTPTKTDESGYKRKSMSHKKKEIFSCGWTGCGFAYDYADYGKTWLAYDRKPEGVIEDERMD